MYVVDIMTANPVVIRPEARLREALRLMDEHQFHHLPVVSHDGRLLGIISDRDCRLALKAPYLSYEEAMKSELANQLLARSIMSPAPVVIEPDSPITEAIRLMLEHRIGCLPVLRSETVVGIITRTDILAAFGTMINATRSFSSKE